MSARPTAPATAIRRPGARVYLCPPRQADGEAFLAAVRASRRLHGRWVLPPSTPAAYAAYVRRFGRAARRDPTRATHAGFLVRRCDDDAIVGVFNLSEIVRGPFLSAYLGYYALAPHARQGYMGEAFDLVLDAAFRTLRLHRIEVNVQPGNAASLRLVERAGFAREGYSRRYVKIAGRWRDHLRYALLAEDWRSQRALRR
jgi:[ribosomal protein S5]-alanine N-acetyltransferase